MTLHEQLVTQAAAAEQEKKTRRAKQDAANLQKAEEIARELLRMGFPNVTRDFSSISRLDVSATYLGHKFVAAVSYDGPIMLLPPDGHGGYQGWRVIGGDPSDLEAAIISALTGLKPKN